ncbi:MAG: HU family DNA-binding protein [Bacteroidota bacterium]
MSVNYKPVPKKNPSQQAEPAKYYAQVVSSGDLTLRQLAKQISSISTVSTADTMAVIEAFLEVVPQALADGKIVRLGDFGSFNLTASSTGAADAAALSSTAINKVSVKFRPGKEFAKVIDAIEFAKTT